MLRSVEQEGRPVVEAAETFGLSRPVFYVTQESVQARRPARVCCRASAGRSGRTSSTTRRSPSWPRLYTRPDGCSRARSSRRFWHSAVASQAHPRSILRRLLPYLQAAGKKTPMIVEGRSDRRHADTPCSTNCFARRLSEPQTIRAQSQAMQSARRRPCPTAARRACPDGSRPWKR